MKVSVSAFVFLICHQLCCGQTGHDEYREGGQENPAGGSLKLSPFILSGKLRQAKQFARVDLGNITSYSGFLTVNAAHCESNLFFWFFPAINDVKTSPVILWHGGGPGTSGMVGLFTEHGPFYVPTKEANSLKFRNNSWALTHSVIYIDSPVGSGFSYTEDESCYCESSDEAAKDIYDALIQFFAIFPEFRKNDFFVSSGSYGGKFAPAIAFKIHLENQLLSAGKQMLAINLKGLLIGSGFTDPINQIDYGDFYYIQGLISEEDRDYFLKQEEITKQFIKAQQWEDAFDTCEPLVIGCCFPHPTLSFFQNSTGFSSNLNMMYANKPASLNYHVKFLDSSLMRETLHVGNVAFNNSNNIVYEKLKRDIYQSLRPIVEELLNADYRFLIYSGQLDLVVPHTTVRKYIDNLSWKHGEEFHKSKRKIWTSDNGELAGYVQAYGGLTYILVRNAGHKVAYDQPQSIFELVTNFTRNSFA